MAKDKRWGGFAMEMWWLSGGYVVVRIRDGVEKWWRTVVVEMDGEAKERDVVA